MLPFEDKLKKYWRFENTKSFFSFIYLFFKRHNCCGCMMYNPVVSCEYTDKGLLTIRATMSGVGLIFMFGIKLCQVLCDAERQTAEQAHVTLEQRVSSVVCSAG